MQNERIIIKIPETRYYYFEFPETDLDGQPIKIIFDKEKEEAHIFNDRTINQLLIDLDIKAEQMHDLRHYNYIDTINDISNKPYHDYLSIEQFNILNKKKKEAIKKKRQEKQEEKEQKGKEERKRKNRENRIESFVFKEITTKNKYYIAYDNNKEEEEKIIEAGNYKIHNWKTKEDLQKIIINDKIDPDKWKNRDNDKYLIRYTELPYEMKKTLKKINYKKLNEDQLSIFRKTPSYNYDIAKDYEAKFMANGFVKYNSRLIQDILLNNTKNVLRKLINHVIVMKGKGRLISETVARAGAGKSVEDETALEYIPLEYIFKINNITYASATRKDEKFYDRCIIYFGDLGNTEAYKKIKDVLDIFKILITDKEYYRELMSEDKEDIKKFYFYVDAIEVVYQTVKGGFTIENNKEDDQFVSRTIKYTPPVIDTKELIKFKNKLYHAFSKQSINKERALSEILNIQEYIKMIINLDLEIVNPYESVFMKALGSNVDVRVNDRLYKEFESYCLLTYYDCLDYGVKRKAIASVKQLKEFFNEIIQGLVIAPVEYNFLSMLKAEKKPKELEYLTTEEEETELFNVSYYMNDVLEELEYLDGDKVKTIDDLEPYSKNKVLNRLLTKYRLGGRATDHDKNIFFTKSDIKRVYKSNRHFKNIDDLGYLLRKLTENGHISKLEYKAPNTHENIYYLTLETKEALNIGFDVSEEDIKEANKFLKDLGINYTVKNYEYEKIDYETL